MSQPPPKVTHLKIGNMKLNQLYDFLTEHWDEILNFSEKSKLVNVYDDKLYSIN